MTGNETIIPRLPTRPYRHRWLLSLMPHAAAPSSPLPMLMLSPFAATTLAHAAPSPAHYAPVCYPKPPHLTPLNPLPSPLFAASLLPSSSLPLAPLPLSLLLAHRCRYLSLCPCCRCSLSCRYHRCSPRCHCCHYLPRYYLRVAFTHTKGVMVVPLFHFEI